MLTYLILGMLGALAGYTVYTLTVEVLDRTNIKSLLGSALGKVSANRKMRAVIKEMTKNTEHTRVKLDILDELDGRKIYEAEIIGKTGEQSLQGQHNLQYCLTGTGEDGAYEPERGILRGRMAKRIQRGEKGYLKGRGGTGCCGSFWEKTPAGFRFFG